MNILKIIAFATILLFLTGCSDSNLEKENANLKKELNTVNRYNNQLKTKLSRFNNLEKELNKIKKNNKNLSITLAKSELLFSKKYKEELKKEENLLEAKRVKIENNARLIAEENAKNKYMTIIISLVVFFLAFIGLSLFKRNEYNKNISNKEIEIDKLKKSIAEANQKVEESRKLITTLETRIQEMEIRAKEVSINQVVRKIDENQEYRSNLLKRIEKDLTHA